MFKLAAITILTLVLFACESKSVDLERFMVDISEFKMDSTALEDKQYVEILGASGNLTSEDSMNDFYNLIVVRSPETGDTVNVLVTNFFLYDLNDPTTRFLKTTTLIGKILKNNDEIKKSVDVENIDIENLEVEKYDKVFYDTEYISEDVRHFPTILGILGDFTIEESGGN